jgi:hypothetical protein
MPGQYLKYGMPTSFEAFSNSSFNIDPTNLNHIS